MQGTTPTPLPRSSLEQNTNEDRRSEVKKDKKVKVLYAKVKKKRERASDKGKRGSESSGSTDRGSKSSLHSTEDEKRECKSTKHKKEEHNSRSLSSTDRDDPHSKEKRHESKSHRDYPRPSSLASKKQKTEPVYAEINNQHMPSSENNERLRQRNTQPLPTLLKLLRNFTYSQTPYGAPHQVLKVLVHLYINLKKTEGILKKQYVIIHD